MGGVYEHTRTLVHPEHAVRLQVEVLMPALLALLSQYGTYNCNLMVANHGPTLRVLEIAHEVFEVENFETSIWYPDSTQHHFCFSALITAINLSVNGDFDEATLFSALTVHVAEYFAVYDGLFGTSSVGLLEIAKLHLPVLGSASYSFDIRPALLFVLRAVSTMCGVPILMFRHHNGTYPMDLILPCILLDNVPQ